MIGNLVGSKHSTSRRRPRCCIKGTFSKSNRVFRVLPESKRISAKGVRDLKAFISIASDFISIARTTIFEVSGSPVMPGAPK